MRHTTHPLLALHSPKKIGDFILWSVHIVESVTGNPYFPSPNPPLATVSAHIQALQAAETTAKTRAKGAAAARDLALQQVETDLHQLAAHVQTVADSKPGEAQAVITSAGFTLRPRGVRAKADLSARMGQGGVVVLRAKSVGKRAAYEWQVSADGGKTWTPVAATPDATTEVPGLSPAATYVFRCRGNRPKKPGDWYEPVTLIVH